MVTLNVDKIQLLSLYKENYLTCKHTCESEMMKNDFPSKGNVKQSRCSYSHT